MGAGQFYAAYDYDLTGAMTKVRENGATSGIGVLAVYTYDDLGRRTGLTRGNGTSSTYTYDAISRLSSLALDLAGGTTNDVSKSFVYNPASQILTQSLSNAAYVAPGAASGVTAVTNNGRNQSTYLSGSGVADTSLAWDGRGNLATSTAVSSGVVATYTHNAANWLTSRTGPAVTATTLQYDPLGRLFRILTSGGNQRFGYDGGEIAVEYSDDGLGTVHRRYVKGAAADETLVWYEGSGTTDRRWLMQDERGSVIAVTDASGAALAINTYDEYGRPGGSNLGRFQYTGQAYIASLDLYYYKARFYDPTIGKFLQSDPIGLAGGMNMYGYVGGDPVNARDPRGLFGWPGESGLCPIGKTVCFPSLVPQWAADANDADGDGWEEIIVSGSRSEGPGGSNTPSWLTRQWADEKHSRFLQFANIDFATDGGWGAFPGGVSMGGWGGLTRGVGAAVGTISAFDLMREIARFQKRSVRTQNFDRSCPMGCRTTSGNILSPGTIGYRFDAFDYNTVQHTIQGSHYNIYILNQLSASQSPPCGCFWESTGRALPFWSPFPVWLMLPGSVDVNENAMQ